MRQGSRGLATAAGRLSAGRADSTAAASSHLVVGAKDAFVVVDVRPPGGCIEVEAGHAHLAWGGQGGRRALIRHGGEGVQDGLLLPPAPATTAAAKPNQYRCHLSRKKRSCASLAALHHLLLHIILFPFSSSPFPFLLRIDLAISCSSAGLESYDGGLASLREKVLDLCGSPRRSRLTVAREQLRSCLVHREGRILSFSLYGENNHSQLRAPEVTHPGYQRFFCQDGWVCV
uniref:Uncharacterized protein n=1 Tax=Setaria viridis TaxID=4556 RepID=A0A4U6W3G3_SETVI|nr:hypothetical protein SEVIR_2G351300v2 [Setaria viridis]